MYVVISSLQAAEKQLFIESDAFLTQLDLREALLLQKKQYINATHDVQYRVQCINVHKYMKSTFNKG